MILDNSLIKHFSDYLRLELSLSDNTISAYCHDIEMFMEHLEDEKHSLSISDITHEDIENFIQLYLDLNGYLKRVII